MRLIQSGPRDAKIMMVGEAPGAKEDEIGRPFSGASGELLDRMASRCGINRNDCFVTNLTHTRPPGNEWEWFVKPRVRPELVQGLLQLKEDIETIKPNLVIAFGGQPLRFLTNKFGIEKWRGSILESTLVKGQKVISTYHPAYCLRIYDYKAVVEFDLRRCKEEGEHSSVLLPQRDLILDPPYDQRPGLLRDLLKAQWLAVDIECTENVNGGGWRLTCVGFSDRPDRAVVIPLAGHESVEFIRALCESDVPKVLQNGTFDSTVLAQNGIALRNFQWDTMLAHHALFPECSSGADEVSILGGKKRQSAIAKGLAFQASIYTREPFYKDDGKLWTETGDVQMFYRYNGLDAAVTREIQDVQRVELEAFGTGMVFEHEMSLVSPLMAATNKGIRIDVAKVKQLKDKYEGEIAKLQDFLDAGAGVAVNVKSPKQVQHILYEKLGLPPKYQRGTGNLTSDKDAINELAAKHAHPILLTILAIRERRDLIERYLDAAYDADGRMRCSFDITGTRSGRLSSRQSIYGSGTNLQTIPPSLRSIFIADPGHLFYYIDLSQAEARVVAYLAEEQGLIDLFNDPTRDVHRENAARIFNKRLEEITPEERYLAKRVIHASNYGMGHKRLVQVVNEDAQTTGVRITDTDAKRLIDAYFMLYPKIREVFWKDVENELRRSRTLTTPFGRKRTFFGRWDEKLLREAYSYIPQSIVGDLCCKGLVRAHNEVRGGQILLNVHDAILGQCLEESIESVARATAKCLAIPVEIKGRTLTIPTDIEVGKNWAHEDADNPDGLKKWKVA